MLRPVLLSLEKMRLRRDEIVAVNYLVGGHGENGVRLSSEVCRGQIRGNGRKLQQGEFQLDIRKNVHSEDVQTLQQGACGVIVLGDAKNSTG